MANNPHINKIEYLGQTLMDLTEDTVTPSDVLSGKKFHDRSGAIQMGSVIINNVYDDLDSTSASDALSANQGKVLNDKINKYQGTRNWVSGVDCNNYTNEGIYSLSDNLTNAPSNATYFTLIVYAPRNDAITQIAIKDDSIFYRMKTLSGWASWKRFAMKGETGEYYSLGSDDGSDTITTIKTNHTLYSNRKFSSYNYVLIMVEDTEIRGTAMIPRTMFTRANIPCNISWVNSSNEQFWVALYYINDTTYAILGKANTNGKTVRLYGIT